MSGPPSSPGGYLAGQVRIIAASMAAPAVPGSIACLGSRFRLFGINKLELVSRIFTSWNRVAEWLRLLHALKDAA